MRLEIVWVEIACPFVDRPFVDPNSVVLISALGDEHKRYPDPTEYPVEPEGDEYFLKMWSREYPGTDRFAIKLPGDSGPYVFSTVPRRICGTSEGVGTVSGE